MNYKRFLAIYMALTMMVGTLSGCGNTLGAASKEETERESVNSYIETEHISSENTEAETDNKFIQNSDVKLPVSAGIEDGMHNIFRGYIGGEEVLMNVSRNGNYINVGIINRKDEETIMSGKIQKDGKQFYVTNVQNEYMIGYLAEGNDDLIDLKGEVVLEDGEQAVTMWLHLDTMHEIGEDESNYYSVNASGFTAEEAEAFAKEIKSKVGDKEEFVELLQYEGLSVKLGEDRYIIKSKEEALLFYDRIMEYNNFRQLIENMFTKYLFANYMGVCVETGNIWFGKFADGIKICAINVSEPLSVLETLGRAVKNRIPLHYSRKSLGENMDVFHEKHDFLRNNEFLNGSSMPKVTEFGIADLDGDGTSEMILSHDDYMGFVVLHEKDGEVYGAERGYRWMYDLKQNGMFWMSGGATYGTISRLMFVEDVPVTYSIAEYNGSYDSEDCYQYGILVDKAVWEEVQSFYNKQPNVGWHQISQTEINHVITAYTGDEELSEEQWAAMEERQEYLDSLLYLVEYTYDCTKEEDYVKENAKLYYDGCLTELNKIYEKCLSQLSGDKKAAFIEEQDMWEHSMEFYMTENDAPFYTEANKQFMHADRVLERILYLIDVYYGCTIY